MIGKVSAGSSFAGLAAYLEKGRGIQDADRVAWTDTRNLATSNPRLAARIMLATANQSARVEKPVYHLSLNFAPGDRPTHETMRAVADQVLRDLGLQDHQVLMVAHTDRNHPHVHLMVNRVHPETGRAWDNGFDYARIERSLRAIEREHGLQVVPGRNFGREKEQRLPGERAWIDQVRAAALGDLRGARSWAELQEGLAAHGLRIEAKGRGMVITDGTHEAKLSDVDRKVSRARLEERIGQTYADYRDRGTQLGPQTPMEAAADSVRNRRSADRPVWEARGLRERAERVRLYEHAVRTERELQGAVDAATRAQVAARAVAERRELHAATLRAFDDSLRQVYADPAAARKAILRHARQHGEAEAISTLRSSPAAFGELRAEDQTRAWGLIRTRDTTAAVEAARPAAYRAELMFQARAHSPTADERVRAEHAARAASSNADQKRRAHSNATNVLREAMLGLLSPEAERAVRAAITAGRWATAAADPRQLLRESLNQLAPRELQRLARLLTSPQTALVNEAVRGLRQALRGREEERER